MLIGLGRSRIRLGGGRRLFRVFRVEEGVFCGRWGFLFRSIAIGFRGFYSSGVWVFVFAFFTGREVSVEFWEDAFMGFFVFVVWGRFLVGVGVGRFFILFLSRGCYV